MFRVLEKFIKNIKIKTLNKTDKYLKRYYHKTIYNLKNKRYNFKNILKVNSFKINYDYLPYKKINKLILYDELANNIYITTGMLNITLLDYYYKGSHLDTLNLNHIDISMSFDNNYALLSYISIASILNTSNIDTYIHFHIILNNCTYKDIKPIIELKKINEKVDLVFYNGKRAEYDFGYRTKKERRGIGELTRLLIPEIVNNTEKILVIDSADIIAVKDLSEIYFFDLEDNYFAISLDFLAGLKLKKNLFARNNFYFNGGIVLINVTKYKKDELYKKAQLASLAYNYLVCPYQDILLYISNFQFRYFPLNFNCPQFFENDEQLNKKTINKKILNMYLNIQKNTPYKYTKEEILEAALNPVILHLYNNKPFNNKANDRITLTWINYAKLTGFYNVIKEKYPLPFQRIENKYNIKKV